MTNTDVHTYRITSPGQCAATLPALVGFTPEESLVAVFLSGDRVIVTSRMDLSEVTAFINEQFVSTAQRLEADAIVLATYTDDASGYQEYWPVIKGLCTALDEAGISVRDALCISGNRFRSYLCQDASCCDPAGIEIPSDPALADLAPDVTGHTRDDVVAEYQLFPEQVPDAALFEDAAANAPAEPLAQAERAWECLAQLAGTSSDDVRDGDVDELRAEFLVLTRNVHVRDSVIAQLASNEDTDDRLVDAIVAATLRAPADLLPRAAGMAAALLAAFKPSSIPATCLATIAGEDSLAQLVAHAVSRAVPPQVLRAMLTESLPLVMNCLTAGVDAA